MSGLTIAPYFPFRRLKILGQSVAPEARVARIQAAPDNRFQPVCHHCGKKAAAVHSWTGRSVRDLDMGGTRIWIDCRYRKLHCERCRRIVTEELELFDPYLRITRRLAAYIHELCRWMTVRDVAWHLGLDWKTVKTVDKLFLEAHYGQPDYEGLRILAVDEISIRKGHRYLTVVLDYETGRVVYVGKARKARTLMRFFNQLSAGQRKAIEAVVMDMWDPYIKAVKKNCPRPESSSISSTSWPALAA
jgi:transposase